MKQCFECKVIKPITDFHISKSRKDGHSPYCKTCACEKVIVYYRAKRAERLEYAAKYREQNPLVNKTYYENNPLYFEKYREQRAGHYKQWRQDNKAKLRAYRRHKIKTDINFKLSACLRSRLSTLISRAQTKKSAKTLVLLGCSIDQLKQHLASKFQPNMSWENYGKWHIDHVKPCSKFDLTDPVQQKECFHYSNLQPLWAKDNLRKGSKISA